MKEELSTNENVVKTFTHPKTGKFIPGNPGGGRPPGQKNIQTLFREAMVKLATQEGLTVDDYEREIISKGLTKAKEGDYKFYQDFLDRSHGKPINRNENVNLNKDMDKLPEEDKDRISSLLYGESQGT